VDGWVAEIYDVTPLKQAQHNVIEMNQELKRCAARARGPNLGGIDARDGFHVYFHFARIGADRARSGRSQRKVQ